jgi:hypothetical protein
VLSETIPCAIADRCRRPPVEEELRGVDFSSLLFDLRRARWSVVAIAKAISLSRQSIRNYQSGDTMPKHHAGELIIRFWCEQLGKRREDAPTRRIYKTYHVDPK